MRCLYHALRQLKSSDRMSENGDGGILCGPRGNHLSNTTCLTLVFIERGEECSKLWCSLTRRKTPKTNEAVLDKSSVRRVAPPKSCAVPGLLLLVFSPRVLYLLILDTMRSGSFFNWCPWIRTYKLTRAVGINKLRQLVRSQDYYSWYGEVERVLVAHSRVQPAPQPRGERD